MARTLGRTDEAPAWQQHSACGPDNADAFFIEKVGRGLAPANVAALQLCRSCPVRVACYDQAAASPRRGHTFIAGGAVWRARPKNGASSR